MNNIYYIFALLLLFLLFLNFNILIINEKFIVFLAFVFFVGWISTSYSNNIISGLESARTTILQNQLSPINNEHNSILEQKKEIETMMEELVFLQQIKQNQKEVFSHTSFDELKLMEKNLSTIQQEFIARTDSRSLVSISNIARKNMK